MIEVFERIVTFRIVSGPVTQLARDDKYQNRTPQLFKMQDPEKQTLFGGNYLFGTNKNIRTPHPSGEGEHSLEYRVQIIALIEVFHEL